MDNHFSRMNYLKAGDWTRFSCSFFISGIDNLKENFKKVLSKDKAVFSARL